MFKNIHTNLKLFCKKNKAFNKPFLTCLPVPRYKAILSICWFT